MKHPKRLIKNRSNRSKAIRTVAWGTTQGRSGRRPCVHSARPGDRQALTEKDASAIQVLIGFFRCNWFPIWLGLFEAG
jgi:hypothetical protein